MHSPGFDLLVPKPRRISSREGIFELPAEVSLAGIRLAPARGKERLREALARARHAFALPSGGTPTIRLAEREIPGGEGGREGYTLEIGATHIVLFAGEAAGFFYGLTTLAQLVSLNATDEGPCRIPCARIEDHPGFAVRGAMLDISRNRIPTMETLFRIVELLSGWKYNQLQLYTEHTFAYAGHEEVWRGWDPITPEEMCELNRFCAERFIELVPNQQSFGHLHRWLVHERYRDLAECPEGVEHPFSFEREPFSLNPRDPRGLALLEELYDQLLPCFCSNEFNVGLDETFDLGRGRSRAAVEEHGLDRVYLEFLNQVEQRVRARGKRMHFWADIVLHHPERVAELPEGVVPNLWGYEAEHPFERECALVASSGLDFIVCPGTSSWQSIGGRLRNMLENVASAVRHARNNAALGILVTDWGDRGHLQPLPVSYPGWLAAGAAAWNPQAPSYTPDELAERLDLHVFAESNSSMGSAWIALAGVAESIGLYVPNASPLSLLLTQAHREFPTEELTQLTGAGLEAGLEALETAEALLSETRKEGPEAELLADEFAWCTELLRFTCHLGLARLRRPGRLEDLGGVVTRPLGSRLSPLVDRHDRLWKARSRQGGSERSLRWLVRVLDRL
ncbi:MAG: glycoside hydrolase [Planctomycetes bacterium]|jgi:hypothetical protein|nr:glycoside hydrolase [Planctomycetota bacterium]